MQQSTNNSLKLNEYLIHVNGNFNIISPSFQYNIFYKVSHK